MVEANSPGFRQEPIIRLTEPGCPMASRLATPASPALRSDPMALSGASSRKQIPSNSVPLGDHHYRGPMRTVFLSDGGASFPAESLVIMKLSGMVPAGSSNPNDS